MYIFLKVGSITPKLEDLKQKDETAKCVGLNEKSYKTSNSSSSSIESKPSAVRKIVRFFGGI